MLLSEFDGNIDRGWVMPDAAKHLADFLSFLDNLFGLGLTERSDITPDQKQLLIARQEARNKQDWNTADTLRDTLIKQGISVRDGAHGQLWNRL